MQRWLQMLHYLLSYVKLMLSIRLSTLTKLPQSYEFVYMIIANMVIKEMEIYKQIFQAI